MYGASPAKILDLVVPSPERFPSPHLHFASINAKSAAALKAVFGEDFDVSDHLGVQLIKVLSASHQPHHCLACTAA